LAASAAQAADKPGCAGRVVMTRAFTWSHAMIDTFAALPLEIRKAKREQYRAFLVERDGEVDYGKRTLSHREARMQRFEQPPARVRSMDEQAFALQYSDFDLRRRSTPEMLLLLALVKINSAEAFGVNAGINAKLDAALKGGDDLEPVLMVEEHYHTRILLSAATLYGIEVHAPYEPPSALRILIHGVVHTPESIARPLTLAGEILGTLAFAKLLTTARKVLKDDPELADSVEERITDVLIDELGHISFNRLCLGSVGLAQARLLLPLLARGLSSAMPEARAIGIDPVEVLADLPLIADPSRLPETVRKQAFFA
jgi:hypothetical protein